MLVLHVDDPQGLLADGRRARRGVSLAHEEGLVRYDPDNVTRDELRRTLEQICYTWRDPDNTMMKLRIAV